MTHRQEDAPKSYPYHPLEDCDGYDQALDLLKVSKKDREDEFPHIPIFAHRMLEELISIGLLHRRNEEPPSNVRRVKVGNEQELWVRFDTRKEDEGYTAVDVVDAPRSDAAILAAMIAWVARPIDFERVLEAKRFLDTREAKEQEAKADAIVRSLERGEDVSLEEDVEATTTYMYLYEGGREYIELMDYVRPLVEYFKPEAKNYSPEEFNDLLRRICKHINDFLEAFRRLQAVLEYGAPNRKLAPLIKRPKPDVKAAVLHDVEGLSYREIGERMGIPFPPDFEIKGEHQTVRKMVERGRGVLKGAFGEEGWQERAEIMKAEKVWWQSLSEEERDQELAKEWKVYEWNVYE